MKIFQMNDCDWYAAETAEDALRAVAQLHCYETTPEGIAAMRKEYSVDDPVELDDEQMGRLTFRDEDDEDCDEEGPKFRSIPFRQKLDEMIVAGEEFPCFFASTEF